MTTTATATDLTDAERAWLAESGVRPRNPHLDAARALILAEAGL